MSKGYLKKGLACIMAIALTTMMFPPVGAQAQENDVIVEVYPDTSPGGIGPGSEILLEGYHYQMDDGSAMGRDVDIFYTTDGSEPTENSVQYTDPIKITDYTQLKLLGRWTSPQGTSYFSDVKQYVYAVDNKYNADIESQYFFDGDAGEAGVENSMDMQGGWGKEQYLSGADAIQGEPSSTARSRGNYYHYKPAGEKGFTSTLTASRAVVPYIDSDSHYALSFWVYVGEKDNREPDDARIQAICLTDAMDPEIKPYTLSCSKASGWQHYYLALNEYYSGKQVKWQITASGSRDLYLDDVMCVNMEAPPVQYGIPEMPDENSQIALTSDSSVPDIYYNTAGQENDFAAETFDKYDKDISYRKTNSNGIYEDYNLYAYAKDPASGISSALSFQSIGSPYPAPVQLSPSGGTVAYGTQVSMTCETRDAEIYYTTDGSEPLDESGNITGTLYHEPVTVNKSMTIKAVSVCPSKYSKVGEIISDDYNLPACEKVQASIPSAMIKEGAQVTLSTQTKGAVIRYTLDGSTPGEDHGTIYSEPITVTEDTTVLARAFKERMSGSKTSRFEYHISSGGDIFEENDTLKSACTLSFPFQIQASISSIDDVDYYRFDYPASGNISFVLEQPVQEGTEYTLELLDLKGRKIELSQGMNLKAGTYYAVVKGGGTCAAAPYTLRMSKVASDNIDFSEMNLVTTQQHSKSPYSSGTGNMNSGGDATLAQAYFSRWSGPVMEWKDPFHYAFLPDAIENDKPVPDETIMEYHNLPSSYHLQKTIIAPLRVDDLDLSNIKNIIRTYGAVTCNLMMDTSVFHDETQEYYYEPMDVENCGGEMHALAAAGWDDTIPKENFSVEIDGITYTPPGDGGFLLKNSWGESYHGDGYFYVSYYNKMLFDGNSMAFVVDETNENYNLSYEYDELGPVSQNVVPGDTVYGKNVFTAQGNEALRAVSFYTTEMDQYYDIYLSIDGAKQQLAASGMQKYSGYHTIRLDSEFILEKGSEFAVIVRLHTPENNQSTFYTEGYIGDAQGSPQVRMTSKKGESFLSPDGIKWTDYSAQGINVCIKAFTYKKGAKNTVMKTAVHKAEKESRIYSPEEWNERTDTVSVTEENKSAAGYYTGGIAMEQTIQPVSGLPEAFSLKDIGAMTPVKNQGQLGVCWAFASIASAESSLKLHNNQAYGYPLSLAIKGNDGNIKLTEKMPEQTISLSAVITPEEVGTDSIIWNFEGDLDSVDILTHSSVSGEDTALLNAKGEGTVTITAVSAADVLKTASTTVTISKENGQQNEEDKQGAKDNQDKTAGDRGKTKTVPGTGDNADIVIWLLLAACCVSAVLLKKH